ncbi:MAG: toxin [Phormidesmis priestleyi]|uniref:Toxin n=1 Tax=Phormidesmis priestleyi TaxID=268141 RepID=A0A2W4WT52_9CYAN|nr:MAG: toxin [Phormidesmis priestleyi]
MFEYDPNKSQANQAKHGLDFEQAQSLWKDPFRLEIKALSDSEPRFMVIGKLEDKHWSVIVTYRAGNIRIISARRSRIEEVDLYER